MAETNAAISAPPAAIEVAVPTPGTAAAAPDAAPTPIDGLPVPPFEQVDDLRRARVRPLAPHAVDVGDDDRPLYREGAVERGVEAPLDAARGSGCGACARQTPVGVRRCGLRPRAVPVELRIG